jgi:hypothetical protein
MDSALLLSHSLGWPGVGGVVQPPLIAKEKKEEKKFVRVLVLRGGRITKFFYIFFKFY